MVMRRLLPIEQEIDVDVFLFRSSCHLDDARLIDIDANAFRKMFGSIMGLDAQLLEPLD